MTQSKPQQPSWRHHYIPEFYLKRWTRGDGQLVEYAKGPTGIRLKPKYPKGTGWDEDLYSVKLDNFEDVLERRFFDYVDGRADKVFDRLLVKAGLLKSAAEISSMSRFIMSLLLRDPESVASTRTKIERDYPSVMRAFQDRYEEKRSPSDPEDVIEYFRINDPQLESRFFLRIMQKTIDNPRIGSRLNAMRWVMLDVSQSEVKLLTSDRPVVVSDYGIGSRASYVALPMSPTRALVGVNDPALIDNLESHGQEETARDLNLDVVRQAKRFVYGSDDAQSSFIEQHFGTRLEPTLQELMRALPMPFSAFGRERL